MAANMQVQITPTVSAEALSSLQHAVENFDRTQLIWSSGYLAGLAGSTAALSSLNPLQPGVAANAAQAKNPYTWHVFFATETGNSRKVAEQFVAQAQRTGFTTELHDLSLTKPKFLKNIDKAIFVLATHGIGDAPERSETFFDYWWSDKAPRLEHLDYSVLALGDSSYADFCEVGRRFDLRLTELGATSVVERIDCDLDFEEPAEDWLTKVVDHAQDASPAQALSPSTHLRPVPDVPVYSKQSPFSAEVLTRQIVTGRGSSKSVVHLELDLENSGLTYQPGDSLGVLPTNPPQLVEQLLHKLNLNGDEAVTVSKQSTSLHEALFRHREITALSRPILDAVATKYPQLQEILANRDLFSDYLESRQLTDLLHEFPVDWQPQELVDALRTLTPRLYSIASSLDANAEEAHLTVALVDYQQYGRQHWGSASTFLNSDTTHAQVFVEPNENFRLPDEQNAPIIMVGAGTGVAPYRAFIEHRREHGHDGKNWLIFGDRNVANDFLYQIEWLRYRKEGSLDRLHVAFSRDQEKKIYVQDRIREHGAELFSWLENGAHFYVCGDAKHMANDVHHALLSVIEQHGGHSADEAHDYVASLKHSRRYQRDVY